MKLFTEKVLEVVKKIPKGKVMTYKEVAKRAGSAGASRAVGSILKQNYNLEIPCHRVIRSDGVAGEYNRGRAEKIRKLKAEGAAEISVSADPGRAVTLLRRKIKGQNGSDGTRPFSIQALLSTAHSVQAEFLKKQFGRGEGVVRVMTSEKFSELAYGIINRLELSEFAQELQAEIINRFVVFQSA